MSARTREGRVESFHRMLERRVRAWLDSDEAKEFPCATLYAHLPGLFLMLTRVALDPRVAARERTATMSSLKYIVAPFDLIPEGVVGTSGFRDDLVLAAMVVDHLVCRGLESVLREHWEHGGDPLEVAREILDAGDRMVGREACEQLRQWLPS